tara:strand:- start:3995 stop:5242 length:1248 start_codon:yes stop_codon:yes gene_type:complete
MHAIALKPDYAEAHNNLANALKEIGRLADSEASYIQAIALRPSYAEAHNNLGVTLQELGRLDEAESSYKKAIALQPEYAAAHQHLSSIKIFTEKDEQYSQMSEMYYDESITEEKRCLINFGLAKACENLGDFEQAFTHYREGNELRKKLLNYDIEQDTEVFRQIKSSYLPIEYCSLQPDKLIKDITPFFIVGMPRSGTTLVEQIISSHSQVTGAGELAFVPQFGAALVTGIAEANNDSLLKFRTMYLTKLKSLSNGNIFITDKMPQNFYYIGLLAAALPEAKIIHVKRNPTATCWSNYKQHFAVKGLGYSYDLLDVVQYFRMYEGLIRLWDERYPGKIYHLDYEQLTTDQETETRKLIQYLGIDWEDSCLSPEKNMRYVQTASNLKVRKKVYKDSSKDWKKFEKYLYKVFGGLPN